MWVDILLPLYKKQRWKLFEGYGYPVLFWSTLLMQMNCVRPAIEGLVCKLACRKNIELINRNLILLNSIHDNMIVHYRCWWVWWFAPRSRIQNNCSLTFVLCVRLHKWKWRWSTPPNGAKMVDGVGLPARVTFLSTTNKAIDHCQTAERQKGYPIIPIHGYDAMIYLWQVPRAWPSSA